MMLRLFLRPFLFAALLVAGFAAPAAAQPFPHPILRYVNQFPDAGLIHVDLTVVNWHAYAPALFVPAPKLPPCGINPNASRTWVDIYNAVTKARIYGFCALGAPSDLQKLWFATPPASKPKLVFIVMTDRLLHRRVVSNRVIIP